MSNNFKNILHIIDFILCCVFETEPLFSGFYADLYEEDIEEEN